jgi:hypothetical protein
MNAEQRRLEETRSKAAPWKKWGPYLSERQRGTVREDYSDYGQCVGLTSRTTRPARGPIAGARTDWGISDDQQLLCSRWRCGNGRAPDSQGALFALTNSEANHGEDVKEYYFYLDSTRRAAL